MTFNEILSQTIAMLEQHGWISYRCSLVITSDSHMDYSAVGQTTNLTSCIEQMDAPREPNANLASPGPYQGSDRRDRCHDND